MDPTLIFRCVTTMLPAEMRRLALWSAAERGTAQVPRWQSAELRARAAKPYRQHNGRYVEESAVSGD